MAIYHLHHSTIGKVNQRSPHTAAAHVAYISRKRACSALLSERMPEDAKAAQGWLCEQEDEDRKNARIVDKVTLALPRELSAVERTELVKQFAERVTRGKAPWMAAVHDKQGNDKSNPHCHLVIRDRDPETGKRALHLSAGPRERRQLAQKGIHALSTEEMRELWAEHANHALEKMGAKERIDHRSLAEQGVERDPTIHEGVKVRQMEKRGEKPVSKVVELSNSVTAKGNTRSVDYERIDDGKTRTEHNAEIINLAAKRKEREQAASTTENVQSQQSAKDIETYMRERVKKRSEKQANKEQDRPRRGRDRGYEPDW